MNCGVCHNPIKGLVALGIGFAKFDGVGTVRGMRGDRNVTITICDMCSNAERVERDQYIGAFKRPHKDGLGQ